jgi:hypothetical protein
VDVIFSHDTYVGANAGDKLQLDNATIKTHLKSELGRNWMKEGGVTFCKSAVTPVPGPPYLDAGCMMRSCKKPAAGLLGAHFTDIDFWEMANADFSAAVRKQRLFLRRFLIIDN